MEIRFDGKRALVTGGGKGIGKNIALALHRCGAETVVLSRSKADLDILKQQCPDIQTLAQDLSDWQGTRTAVQSLGHFDLLVNNAGVGKLDAFLDVTEKDIDFIFSINYKGLFNVSQVVAQGMVDEGRGGAIVNISSVASKMGLLNHAVYCSSKGAVDSLTQVMALELGPKNK